MSKWIFSAFVLFQISIGSAVMLTPGISIDGSSELRMIAGEPSNWDLWYERPDGSRVHHFMEMHEKPMHMIVVKNDLSSFAHVHPSLNHHMRMFRMGINQESSDPDNFDAIRAVTEPGEYTIFTESMPMGTEMMLMNRFPLQVDGESSRSPTTFEPVKYPFKFFLDENGERAEEGARYQLVFNVEQFEWCSWWLPKFYFDVYELRGNKYEPAEGLQRWLGMGGHSILVSLNGGTSEKTFYHLHAFLPQSEPGQYVFPYHDHSNALPEGMYKIWFQFKHADRVFTVPVPFEYKWPKEKARGLDCR